MATLAEPRSDTDEAFREEVRDFLAKHFPPGSADRNELPNHLIILD